MRLLCLVVFLVFLALPGLAAPASAQQESPEQEREHAFLEAFGGVLADKPQKGSALDTSLDQALQADLRARADKGFAPAQYALGYRYEHSVPADYQQAAAWYRKAAEQGHTDAQTNLGFLYEMGNGVAQDYKQAVEWYRNAAEQGNAGAQAHLGLLYHEGRGLPQDYKQAVEWYRKAAEQGSAVAQFNLGGLYESGYGVPQDYEEAYFWMNLANAEFSDPSVARSRDEVARNLTPQQITAVQKRVREWKPVAAQPSGQ